MSSVWQRIHWLLSGVPEAALSNRTAIVALVGEQERSLLSVLTQQKWDVHFAESGEQAQVISNQLSAPMILYDRDWPHLEWRAVVRKFASSPHRPCVILLSRVADEYLWDELIRHGGYDILAKPLRPDDVARVMKLALSYWKTAGPITR
jgi:DNA-binding NtrC family response regulator